jgi:hypothetical protein
MRTAQLEDDYQKKSQDFAAWKHAVEREDLVKKYA